MKSVGCGVSLSLALCAGAPLAAQVQPSDAPSRTQVVAAAKAIMQEARYCTFVTAGRDGQPQARIVDPFPPDSDFVVWIATNALTRKVEEIRRNPRVTLLYFSAATFEYVTVIGTAVLDSDPRDKAAHWKPEWAGMYKDQNRGDDYLLVRVKATRLEVVSTRRGILNDPKTWRPVIVNLP